jgi:hypothetical protein
MSATNDLSTHLQYLAAAIDDALTDTAGNRCTFVLLVSHDGVAQYVSNASRTDGTALIEQLLERWKQGRADIPAHYNPDLKKD